MAFRDDNTTIIRMKRDFDSFIQDHNQSGRVPTFNLDNGDTGCLDAFNRSGDTEGMPVQVLLEREKQMKLKEAEYIAAKTQILQLQSKLNSLETKNKRARIEMEQQVENAFTEKRHESERVNELMSQLKFMKDRETQVQESLATCQQEMETERTRLEKQILTLQKEKIQLSDDMQQEKERNWEKMSELRGELMRNETELKICKCELEESKAQLKLQMKRSSDITNQMKECEEYKLKATHAEQRIKELELEISRLEEDGVVGKALKTQLATFQEMEKENRKLKDENNYFRETQENNMLLKEQRDSMSKKVERLENKLHKYNSLVAENEDLKSRLDKWESVDKSGSKMKSPTDLSRRVAELQHTEALMLSKQGELKTNLTLKENSLRSLEDQVSSLQQQLANERSKYHQQADLSKRLQRKLLLVTKERDGYKRIIDSYESEVTVSLGPDSSGTLSRLQQLEDSVEGYRKQTDILEMELNKVSTDLTNARQYAKQLELQLGEARRSQQVTGSSSSTEADKQAVVSLRERIASLEKALEKCEEEKHILECRIEQRHLQGDYDPTKLKVLHFKMNPVDLATEQRKEELTKLKEENERLKQRIKLLEENEGHIEDLTVAVEQKLKEPGSSKDIEEIRSQLSLAELKNKRLMEAFKKTSQEVREVCYQLTGYKIDFPTPNNYKVTSMYAESPGDYLQFQQSSNGEIQMLRTSFSSSVQDLMETYLIEQDSIPAFLSSITLKLFSGQTMNIS